MSVSVGSEGYFDYIPLAEAGVGGPEEVCILTPGSRNTGD